MELCDLNIAVIGAGIGGVAAATALARRGGQVTVFEQAEHLSEVGAGLQISANGMVVLRDLGVVGDEPPLAVRSSGTQLRDYHKGRGILHVPPPVAGPTWYFHRADLLGLLVDGARAAGVGFELGNAVTGADPWTGKVKFGNSKSREFDLIIAADGGLSPSRLALNGANAPQFSRQVAWRAVVPWDATAGDNSAVLTMGPDRHVVTYPLRGGAMMNIVAIEEREDWTDDGWRLKGDPDEMRARFTDFGGAVKDILARVEDPFLWALYLHPVAAVWHQGRLALLGDAAHPTLPFMAQGACMALEDAWAIAACLGQAGSIEQGLESYQILRHARVTRVVAAAVGNAGKFHHAPPVSWVAQAALMAMGRRFAPRYEWIYGYDVTRA